METPILAALWQALTATSRRGVLAGLAGAAGLRLVGPRQQRDERQKEAQKETEEEDQASAVVY